MRQFLIVVLSLSMLGVFERPAEAGLFFRRGPIRRLLFGPFRRRMIPRMFRRGPCRGCGPRNFVNPRNFCGPGVHGGRCGFNDFRFRGNQFESNFLPGGVDPRFNRFSNPFSNGSNFFPNSFDDFRNRNLGRGITPVSRLIDEPQSSFEKQFRSGLLPNFDNIRSKSWSGQCELENGRKAAFDLDLSDESVESVKENGLHFPQTAQLGYLVRTNADASKLFVRVDSSAASPRFCVLDKN